MLVFTSCVSNYLPKARVLAHSIKQFHPDWTFCLLLGESAPSSFNLDDEPFDRLLFFEEVGPANYNSWRFSHRLVELCTAIKGFALNYFLEQEGHAKVLYLDPDILVLNSLSALDDLLDQHDILLTPHQLAPQMTDRAIWDNEICSLRHGVFNLGFMACANTGEGVRFSRFWRDRLQYFCKDDLQNGLFTDQKWCDLVPAYFPSSYIIRDPGFNAASWNLTDRIITRNQQGVYFANDKPLRFYHFTGYDSGMGKIMSDVYGKNMPAVAKLWQMYEKRLNQNQKEPFKKWSGGFYANGEAITDEARLYYRDTPGLAQEYPNPYLTDNKGRSGFVAHWRSHKAREKNLLYVWARKPFRLAWLASIYLNRRGGISALPELCRAVHRTWRKGGVRELISRVRKFKTDINTADSFLPLSDLVNPDVSPYWASMLANAFAGTDSVLIFDHMYGGGANDYRAKRIDGFLGEGRPCLLALWDFFANRLRLQFFLPNGRSITAGDTDLSFLETQNILHFGLILVNELVLWSVPKPPKGSHYYALPKVVHSILALKQKNSARLEIAIHDFYAACPNYTLLNAEKYCGVPEDMQKCRDCLDKSPFEAPRDFDLPQWRATWQLLFDNADSIVFFSRSSKNVIERCLRLNPDHIQIRPHAPLAPLRPPNIPGRDDTLNICVVGHIAIHKGANIVREMAKLLQKNERLVIAGELEGEKPENITVLGAYKREDLPAIMEKENISVCLVPSIWPETFCYVAQEIMQMDLPLVVFPLGAQAERVSEYHRGRVANSVDAEAALAAIRDLHAGKSA